MELFDDKQLMKKSKKELVDIIKHLQSQTANNNADARLPHDDSELMLQHQKKTSSVSATTKNTSHNGKDAVNNKDSLNTQQLTTKKARIDHLVEIAKQEMKKHQNQELTLEKLELEMDIKFALSPTSKNEYLRIVRSRLEYEEGITLASEGIGFKDLSVLQQKSQVKFSKSQFFLNIITQLEGDDKEPVSEDALIDALVSSGRFNEDEAKNFIQRMLRESSIYESRPKHYNRL